jgi:DNA-binding NtrC family response regulator
MGENRRRRDNRTVATRVLVIDDEAPIRLLCRVNLEAEGMEVL